MKKLPKMWEQFPRFLVTPKIWYRFESSRWNVVCVLVCNPSTRARFCGTPFSLEQTALLYQSATHDLVQLSLIDNLFSGKTVNKAG